MLIRTISITLLALTAACASEPDAASTTNTTTRSVSCDHGGFSCNPRHPGSDSACSLVCEGEYHCREYSWDEIEWCDRYPGTHYRGRTWQKCSYSIWGGDPTWDTQCLPGAQPVAPDPDAAAYEIPPRAFPEVPTSTAGSAG